MTLCSVLTQFHVRAKYYTRKLWHALLENSLRSYFSHYKRSPFNLNCPPFGWKVEIRAEIYVAWSSQAGWYTVFDRGGATVQVRAEPTNKKKYPGLKLGWPQGQGQGGMSEEDWLVSWAPELACLQTLPLDKKWYPHAQTLSTHFDPAPEQGWPRKGV
jgi:hypothetical protein